MSDTTSLVDNLTEYDIVEVFNPLSIDFQGKVATSVVNPTAYVDKAIDKMQLRNTNHPTMAHVVNTVTIPSGQTLKMPGHVARVVVTQIVNEVMQREGSVKQMGDKTLRTSYEERIIINSDKFQSNESVVSAEDRLQRQLDELNHKEEIEVTRDEQPFATQQSARPETAAKATRTNAGKAK